MKIHWVNLITMYLIQAVCCLFLMIIGFSFIQSGFIAGFVVGFSFGYHNIPLIEFP